MKFLIPSAGHVRRHPSPPCVRGAGGCRQCRVIPYQGILSQNRKLCPNLDSSASAQGSLLTPAHSGSHNPHNIIVFSRKTVSPFPSNTPQSCSKHRSFTSPGVRIKTMARPGPGVMVILLWTRRQPGHVVYCCKCLIITLRFGSLPTQDYNYISARIWASLSASSFLI